MGDAPVWVIVIGDPIVEYLTSVWSKAERQWVVKRTSQFCVAGSDELIGKQILLEQGSYGRMVQFGFGKNAPSHMDYSFIDQHWQGLGPMIAPFSPVPQVVGQIPTRESV
jgi:hypothetical protein